MTSFADRARMPGATQNGAGGHRARGPAPHRPRPPWAPVQRTERSPSALPAMESGPAPANRTGLPDALKAAVEALSGLAMDDVRVHRNSAEPVRLGALVYAQGSDIHLGPGQERHLPHETWHVVQQKQGRVSATRQTKGLRVNEDQGLEKEADRMSSSLGARCFADAPVQTTASGKTALAAPEAMSESVTGSDHPTQLQKREKNPLQPPTDPNLELLTQKFQQSLRERRLNEEINGGAAKALASAYLSAQVPTISQISMNSVTTYNVTPVQNVAKPPTFEEVYTAILSLMDIASTKDWQNAAAWKWTPAPKESGKRGEAIVEIADWTGEEAVGYATDEVRDSAIRRVAGKAADSTIDKIRDKLLKDIGVRAAVTWEAGIGLKIVAEVSLVVLNVVGWLALAVSVAKLLKILMRPPQKVPTRQDQIRAGVISWLEGRAEAKKPATTNSEVSMPYPARDNVRVGGVEDKIMIQIKKFQEAKDKEAATLQQMKGFDAFSKSQK